MTKCMSQWVNKNMPPHLHVLFLFFHYLFDEVLSWGLTLSKAFFKGQSLSVFQKFIVFIELSSIYLLIILEYYISYRCIE